MTISLNFHRLCGNLSRTSCECGQHRWLRERGVGKAGGAGGGGGVPPCKVYTGRGQVAAGSGERVWRQEIPPHGNTDSLLLNQPDRRQSFYGNHIMSRTINSEHSPLEKCSARCYYSVRAGEISLSG